MRDEGRVSSGAWGLGALALLTLALAASPATAAPTKADATRAGKAEKERADKAACVVAYEKGQVERAQKHLVRARTALVACASSCPATAQRECVAWLAEVDAALPTVVLRARLGGQDTADVRVLVDGVELAARLDGAALAVDPGERRFRFEHPPDAPVEKSVVLGEGDKRRAIEVDFAGASPAPPPSRFTWPVLALGGMGVVGLGAFAVLGITGASRYGELKDTCAPKCAVSDTDPLKTRFLVADIALGVGVVALAGGAYLFLRGPSAPAAPAPAARWRPSFDVARAPGGAMATIRSSF